MSRLSRKNQFTEKGTWRIVGAKSSAPPTWPRFRGRSDSDAKPSQPREDRSKDTATGRPPTVPRSTTGPWRVRSETLGSGETTSMGTQRPSNA